MEGGEEKTGSPQLHLLREVKVLSLPLGAGPEDPGGVRARAWGGRRDPGQCGCREAEGMGASERKMMAG